MFIEGGARLSEERKRLKKTQNQMAESGGVAKSTYCNYEAGIRAPDALFLGRIAEAGADVIYILTGRRVEKSIAPDEAALLDSYRAISDERKGNLVDVATALSQRQSTEKKAVDGK